MKHLNWVAILLVAIIFNACQTTKPRVPQEGDVRYEVPGKGWTNVRPEEPDWVKNPRKYAGKNDLVFVGLSRRYSTERDARDDAMRDAQRQLVEYITKTIGRKIVEVLKQRNLADEVLNPAVVSEIVTKSISIGKISSLYAENYFDIHSQTFKTGAWTDDAYQSYVLTRIPKDDIKVLRNELIDQQKERLRQEREKEKVEERKKLIEDAEKELERLKKEGF